MLAMTAISTQAGTGFDARAAGMSAVSSTIITMTITTTGSPGGGTDMV